MNDKIDITGIPKHTVLKALYDNSRPLGMGFIQEAQGVLDEDGIKRWVDAAGPGLRFDYVQGRVVKVCLAENSFGPSGYDRDNGEGAAARAVDSIRS